MSIFAIIHCILSFEFPFFLYCVKLSFFHQQHLLLLTPISSKLCIINPMKTTKQSILHIKQHAETKRDASLIYQLHRYGERNLNRPTAEENRCSGRICASKPSWHRIFPLGRSLACAARGPASQHPSPFSKSHTKITNGIPTTYIQRLRVVVMINVTALSQVEETNSVTLIKIRADVMICFLNHFHGNRTTELLNQSQVMNVIVLQRADHPVHPENIPFGTRARPYTTRRRYNLHSKYPIWYSNQLRESLQVLGTDEY